MFRGITRVLWTSELIRETLYITDIQSQPIALLIKCFFNLAKNIVQSAVIFQCLKSPLRCKYTTTEAYIYISLVDMLL